MPTRPRLSLPRCGSLLLLAVAAACASADVGGGDDVLIPQGAYARMRPGASSSGPRGMRHVDTAVEPAAFRSLGLSTPLLPAPLEESKSLRVAKNETPPDSKVEVATPPAPVVTAAPLPIQPKPAPAAEPAALPIAPPQHTAESTAEPTAASPPTDAAPLPLPLEAAAAPDAAPGRLLFGPSAGSQDAQSRPRTPSNPLDAVMKWRPSSQQLTATGAGLAITVGLLLAFVWLIRSMAPKSSRPLPREVVEVLGRAPLAGKQMTQLLRIGHKLVLVAITPEGAETLTEITDPDEVARLVAACDATSGRGSTAEFDALLRQMESERIRGGFLDPRGDEWRDARHDVHDGVHDGGRYADASFDPRSLAAAYANTPGGRGDG